MVVCSHTFNAHMNMRVRTTGSNAAAKCRLLWTLSSGSLVFRSHLFTEWYEDRIQPSVHYLPVRLSYLGRKLCHTHISGVAACYACWPLFIAECTCPCITP